MAQTSLSGKVDHIVLLASAVERERGSEEERREAINEHDNDVVNC